MEWITEGPTRILITTSLRYFLLAGIPFLIFYVLFHKRFQKHKIQSRNAGKKRFLSEIKHSLATLIVITASASIIFFTPFREWTQIYTDIHAYPWWWIPMSILVSMVIHDTYFYWLHRAIHSKMLFKYVHRIHHLSVNPSPWTSHSFDMLEAILETGIIFILVFIYPLHPLAILGVGVVNFLFNVYGHLGYEITPRWFRHTFLFEIMNTSVHHNLHHKKFYGNYGLYFRVWDRLMGTENPLYVDMYDEIQARRFGEKAFKRPAVAMKHLSIVFAVLTFAFTPKTDFAPDITGIWEAEGPKGKGIVEVYQNDEQKIYGRFIKTSKKEDQKKVEEVMKEMSKDEIQLLSNFEYIGDSTWENGHLLWMERKMKLDGTLKLLPTNQLQVSGRWGAFSKTFIWDRRKK